MNNAINIEPHVTSPVQFTDEPPMTSDTIRVTVGTVKSDPDTMTEFLSSSADIIPAHVSLKQESITDTITMLHVLLSGTTLKPAMIKLHKLTDIDIDLWTMPKVSAPQKGPLKPFRVILDKCDTSTSEEATLSIKHIRGKSKKKAKPKSVNNSRNVKPKGRGGSNRPKSASPRLSSRVTCSQKIRSGLKSPAFRITVHGLKCFKHKYYYKCEVNPCSHRFSTVYDWNNYHHSFHNTYLKCTTCCKCFKTPSA